MTNNTNTYNVNQMGYVLAGIIDDVRRIISGESHIRDSVVELIRNLKDKVLSGEPANKVIEVYSFLSKLMTYYATCDGNVANKQGHIFVTLDDQRVMIYDNVNMQMVACDFAELYSRFIEFLREYGYSTYIEIIEGQMEKLEREPNPDDFPHDFRFAMNNHNYDGILEIERSFVAVGDDDNPPFMAKLDVIVLKSAVGIHGILASVIALNSMKIREYEPPVTDDEDDCDEDDCDCEDCCCHSEEPEVDLDDQYILDTIMYLYQVADLSNPYDNFLDFTRYVYHRIRDCNDDERQGIRDCYKLLKEISTYKYLPSLHSAFHKYVIVQHEGIALYDLGSDDTVHADLAVMSDLFSDYYNEREDYSYELVEAVHEAGKCTLDFSTERPDEHMGVAALDSRIDVVMVEDSREIRVFDIEREIENFRYPESEDEDNGSPEISVDFEAENSESNDEDWVE